MTVIAVIVGSTGGDVEPALAELTAAADKMLDDLRWWTAALKAARAAA